MSLCGRCDGSRSCQECASLERLAVYYHRQLADEAQIDDQEDAHGAHDDTR